MRTTTRIVRGVLAALLVVVFALAPAAAQDYSSVVFDITNDLYQSRYATTDDDGNRFVVAWPEGVTDSGFEKALSGDWVSRALFLTPLTDPDHRAELYVDVISALATRPALTESVATDFHDVLAELAGPAGAGLQTAEKFAVAFQVASQMNLRYIEQTGTLTRVINDLKQQGRTLREITTGRNFGFATAALQALQVTLTVTSVVSEAVMINALATDLALDRIDSIEESFTGSRIDPELLAAFDEARVRLARNQKWWQAFAFAASEQSTEITGTAFGLASTALSHHVATVLGAKAGVTVALWAIPIALGISEYGEITDTVESIQRAMLVGYMAQELEASGSVATNYAIYHFYYEMREAMDGWLVDTAAFVWSDIAEIRDRYRVRETLIRESLRQSTPSQASSDDSLTVAVGSGAQYEIDGRTELQITGLRSTQEAVLVIGPDYSSTVQVSVGSTVARATEDRPAMVIVGAGDLVLLDPDRPANVYALALLPRYIPSDSSENGDLGRYPVDIEFDEDGYMCAFVVVGEPGAWVGVDLMSDDIDSYLIASSPDGYASMDDDGGSGLNSRLDMQLDEDGRGAIIATSLDGEPGRYELVLQQSAGSAPDADGGLLRAGTPVAGTITSRTRVPGVGYARSYQLRMVAGESVTIDLTSNDFDCYLIVRTPDGEEYTDDDGGSSYNSRLTISSRVSGTATVIATSYGQDDTGGFTILVSSSGTGQGPGGSPGGSPSGGVLSPGRWVTGSISSRTQVPGVGNGVSYQLRMEAGQPVTIDLTSDDFDCYLIVRTPDGNEYSDDDGGSMFDSQLTVTSRRSGNATVIATSYGHDDTGSYEIRAIAEGGSSGGPSSNDPYGGTVDVGSTVSGVITSRTRIDGVGNAISYRVPMRSGEAVTIDLMSDDFDCYLIVTSPDGTTYTDDDGGQGYNSRITFTSQSRGVAEVTATSLSRGGTGEFQLSVQRAGSGGSSGGSSGGPAPGLSTLNIERSVAVNGGTTWASGTVRSGDASYRLAVGASGRLTIEVVVTEIMEGDRWEDDDSMLFLFDEQGRLVAEDDDSGDGMASMIDGVHVSPGVYYAVVTTYANRPELDSGDRLIRFEGDGGSYIAFDLRIELE